MSFPNVFQVAMDLNGPPGLTHPLLVESYAWVDERLRELFYGYALTSDNVDEFQDVGLLQEHHAWVDQKLEEMCALPVNNNIVPLCLAPLTWCNYRSDAVLDCIEDSDESLIEHRNKCLESDISDNEVEVVHTTNRLNRLGCQSPLPINKYIIVTSSVYDEEWDVESLVPTVIDEEFQEDDEDEEF